MFIFGTMSINSSINRLVVWLYKDAKTVKSFHKNQERVKLPIFCLRNQKIFMFMQRILTEICLKTVVET